PRREGAEGAPRTPNRVAPALGTPLEREGSQPRASLLLDDPDLDLGAHFAVQVDGDRVDAEALDRLLEHDVTPVHLEVETLLVQPVRDVRRRDRTEQLGLLARPHLERERDALERRGTPPRLQVRTASTLLGPTLLLLELAEVRLRRLVREAARPQVVARVPRLHGHDLTCAPEVRNVLSQDDFHALHGPVSPDPGPRDDARPRRSSHVSVRPTTNMAAMTSG